jgi:hypothetical protein
VAIPVIQEVRDTVAAATALATEIGLRFKSGDAADGALAELAELVARVPAVPEPVPDDLRAALDELNTRVTTALRAGGAWLADSGSAIAAERVRDRLNRAYGVPPKPE